MSESDPAEVPSSSTSTDQKGESSSRICLVCTDKSDGTHFGIDSCRACAAFFRRSVIGAKKYNCRQGKNSCLVSKTIKSMCRRCRLYKCLHMGMKPECVRDPLPPKPVIRPPIYLSSTTLETDELLSAFRRVKPIPIRPDTVETSAPELLKTIIDHYRHLCSVRKATELAMSKDEVRNMFATEEALGGMKMGNFAELSLFYRAHLTATADFIASSFPEFQALEETEKWTIFQPFVIHYWALDNAYRTWKRCPPEMLHRICVMSETVYMDIERLPEFFPSHLKTEKEKDEASRMFKQLLGRPRLCLIAAVRGMEPELEEYSALTALLIWNRVVEKGCDKVDTLCDTVRNKVYDQLHIYYTNKGISNYAKRLGDIQNILNHVVQFGCLVREFTEVFNMLNLYGVDTFIHDFIKNA